MESRCRKAWGLGEDDKTFEPYGIGWLTYLIAVSLSD